jgi:N-acetylmuramoyl-L-alanine amidase
MRMMTVIFLLPAFFAKGQNQNSSFHLARTASRITMLGYSMIEDSPGGAKLGYLDTSVLLKVIDSSKEMYDVQLSKAHHAYLNKTDVIRDTATVVPPFYYTSSVSIKGDDLYDYVDITLDEKLPYKSWMDVNPARIFLDIYGVQSNSNWINQMRSVKEIKDVSFNQIEDDVVRATIELNHKQHWGYSVYYKNNILCLRVRRQPPSLKVNKLFIALDAGHGGSSNGAVGSTSKGFEKTYTMRFTNELEKYLKKKGATVFMTRTSDTSINNFDRVLMLQQAMPDLLISLHFNSSKNANVKGVSTYYKHIGFMPLTTALLDRLLQLDLSEFGNVGNFNSILSAPTDFPNALVEIAFLSNPDDEKKIIDPRFQKSAAKKIYKGIKDWLKMVRE